MMVMLLSHSGFVCSPPKSIAIIIKPQIFSLADVMLAKCWSRLEDIEIVSVTF